MKKSIGKSKTAWERFSLYIRLKECMETTGSYEQGICCSCKQLFPFSDFDSGHFIAGRTNSILFVEELVHIQCRVCNQYKGGNPKGYEEYMIIRYGQDKVDGLRRLKYQYKKMLAHDYQEIIDYYSNKIKEVGFGWKIK